MLALHDGDQAASQCRDARVPGDGPAVFAIYDSTAFGMDDDRLRPAVFQDGNLQQLELRRRDPVGVVVVGLDAVAGHPLDVRQRLNGSIGLRFLCHDKLLDCAVQ